jgi:hypothetical protein
METSFFAWKHMMVPIEALKDMSGKWELVAHDGEVAHIRNISGETQVLPLISRKESLP